MTPDPSAIERKLLAAVLGIVVSGQTGAVVIGNIHISGLTPNAVSILSWALAIIAAVLGYFTKSNRVAPAVGLTPVIPSAAPYKPTTPTVAPSPVLAPPVAPVSATLPAVQGLAPVVPVPPPPAVQP